MSPEGNIELYKLLRNWNPLGSNLPDGEEFDFDAEIYDSMEALFKYEGDVEKASLGIQEVFYFSFEKKIQLDDIHQTVMEAFEIIELYKEP